jgi:small-conductance mechanosensitive channel
MILRPITVGVMGWVIISILLATGDWVSHHFAWEHKENNMSVRRINTQLRVLIRSSVLVILLLTFIGVAMTIPAIRNLGISLFASAGVASLVVGMAARPAFANLIAGLQIALAQPIRIDDVVIVEGQWGRIEEITLTYVVICIWDLRRLIVPLSYFMEKPFENWTHSASALLGSVVLHVDYALPVEPIRKEFKRILDTSALWNHDTCVLQVTEATEKTKELRALMSAQDASALFDLQCEVREKLIDYIQVNYPRCLPHNRTELMD